MKKFGKKPGVAGPATIFPAKELTPEEAAQFDLEICWCIEQFQMLLTSSNVNDSKKKVIEQSLQILKDPKKPAINKRQVMRQLCGDYKSKIKKKDYGRSLDVNFTENTDVNRESKVIRCRNAIYKQNSFKSSDNSFKFNFNSDDTTVKEEEVDDSVSTSPTNVFQTSDNSFRFNF